MSRRYLVVFALAAACASRAEATSSARRSAATSPVDTLVARIRTGDPVARDAAARTLANLPSPDVRTLAVALRDTSAYVRWAAARALGNSDKEAARPLSAALGDPDVGVRRAAARSLGKIGDPTSLPALMGLTRDPAEEVRAVVAEALGKMGTTAASALRRMAEEDSGIVVAAAIEALGGLSRAEDAPLVGVALLDGPYSTRIAAARALGRIASPHADTLLLAAAADDPEPLVREAAIRALADAAPELVPDVVGERREVEENVYVRLAWVDVLGFAMEGTPGARRTRVTELLRAIERRDGSPRVRAAAKTALESTARDGRSFAR